MKVNLIVNAKNEVCGYRKYPLDPSKPMIELEDFPENFDVGEYIFVNNQIVKKGVLNNVASNNNVKYSKEQLIRAFYEYRNNVNYGIIMEDESNHQETVSWYNAINCDDINAINNPPKIILKYMEGTSWI